MLKLFHFLFSVLYPVSGITQNSVIHRGFDPLQLQKEAVGITISSKMKETELLILKNKYPNIHFFTEPEQQIQL